MLLAAMDHNQHSFRPKASNRTGQPIFKKQYSKRTKHWHPEQVRAEESYDYIPYLIASILRARVDGNESAGRVVSLPENHPRNLASTIPLREFLVQEYRSRFGSKKKNKRTIDIHCIFETLQQKF